MKKTSAFTTLRRARANARLVGVRQKKKDEKEKDGDAPKKDKKEGDDWRQL